MMFVLIPNIGDDRIRPGLTNRKRTVSGLPMKIGVLYAFPFYPFG